MLVAAAGLGLATIARNAEHQSWLTLAEKTLERWPSDAAQAAVGGELSRLGRDEEALPYLRIGARSDARAQYNLGVTLYNLKRYDESIRALEHLVAAHPMREEVPWARRVMAQAYPRQLKWPEAVEQLRMTLAMTPQDAEARRLLVDAYISRGIELAEAQKFNDAISDFRSALSYDERNANARYNLATALFDAGQLNEALVEAERALALNPASADAYHLKGKLLALQGRLDESIVNLETALKLRPDDAVIREDLARCIGYAERFGCLDAEAQRCRAAPITKQQTRSLEEDASIGDAGATQPAQSKHVSKTRRNAHARVFHRVFALIASSCLRFRVFVSSCPHGQKKM